MLGLCNSEVSELAHKAGAPHDNFKASALGYKVYASLRILGSPMDVISQKLPAKYDEKLTKFQRYVFMRSYRKYPVGQISKSGVTPIFVDMLAEYDIDECGTKEVRVHCGQPPFDCCFYLRCFVLYA